MLPAHQQSKQLPQLAGGGRKVLHLALEYGGKRKDEDEKECVQLKAEDETLERVQMCFAYEGAT